MSYNFFKKEYEDGLKLEYIKNLDPKFLPHLKSTKEHLDNINRIIHGDPELRDRCKQIIEELNDTKTSNHKS